MEKLAGEIRSMIVDSNGIIWAGTKHGMKRFQARMIIYYIKIIPGYFLFDEAIKK